MKSPAFVRFVLAGALNTAATWGLFEVLRHALPHLLAYSLTYVIGIGIAYVLNTRFVFRTGASLRSALRFPLVYVGQYLYGLAVMWLLVINGLAYLLYGALSRHFARDLLPLSAGAVRRDLFAALRLKLRHRLGHYNAVQRLSYWLVLALGALVVLSGLAIWKPVQLHGLASLFGGFDSARYVHFFAMAGIAAFVVLHLTLVLLVPSTLPPMITGGQREISHE